MPRKKRDNGDIPSSQAPQRRNLEEDDLVKALVREPSQVPKVITLTGFLGRSTRDGYWRLYLTAELNDYVEFSEEDIRHHHPIPAEQSAVGGTVVWLDRHATIQRTSAVSREAQAEFLRGDLIADVQAQTAGGSLGMGLEGSPIVLLPTVNYCPPTDFCPRPQGGSIGPCETSMGGCLFRPPIRRFGR